MSGVNQTDSNTITVSQPMQLEMLFSTYESMTLELELKPYEVDHIDNFGLF